MTTKQRNPQSPRKDVPLKIDSNNQTIVKQVTTPYVNRQIPASVNSVPLLPSSLYFQKTSGSPPKNMGVREVQRDSGVRQKQASQVVNVNRQLGQMIVPAPTRRVEYVPYQQKYIEYVQQRIQVPVQKACTDYYSVEHITEYVPIQKEEIVYETQPKQVITMKLQYVPVEQKIIHISEKNAKALGITNYVSTSAPYGQIPNFSSSLYQPISITKDIQVEGLHETKEMIEAKEAKMIRRSRTNFVTSDGYDPEANIREIDRLLTASSVSGSRVRTAV